MNRRHFLLAAGAASLSGCGGRFDLELLNVSYDPTRELYRTVNRLFAADYEARTGNRVRVRQSHGGSGSQARAVMDGLPADVVTLAMWTDTDAIRSKGLIDPGWEDRFPRPPAPPIVPEASPNRSLPYFSTIVFAVRKGNPHGIADWPDLLKPGVKVVTANPKTGGGAKLALLGAWGSVVRKGGSEADARRFITELYARVPVLDSGARGATVTFARKGIGDVHLTWENEAYLEERELKGEVEIVHPKSGSIRAEPQVAVVDANARRRGTAEAAAAYLNFLYTDAAQDAIAEGYFRPATKAAADRHAGRFKPLALFTATDLQPGGWGQLHAEFFAEGGLFDQVYQPAG
jgi:sulfate transport system substrate-binding protein